MDQSTTPPYYCMPDMGWSGGKNAGYLHHYKNSEIEKNMLEGGWRIAGNEWDNFRLKGDTLTDDDDIINESHLDLSAVFATSFRTPMDRAVSQFRFECIEDRGCTTKNVSDWWMLRQDLRNIYITTFADQKLLGHSKMYLGESRKDVEKRKNIMKIALNTVSQFNLVLVMEWLAYSSPLINSILGFNNTSTVTKRVRPHAIGSKKRDDGHKENKLGAAGIDSSRWVPEVYLDARTYQRMREDLAMDEVLYDAARRLFLERLVCEIEG